MNTPDDYIVNVWESMTGDVLDFISFSINYVNIYRNGFSANPTFFSIGEMKNFMDTFEAPEPGITHFAFGVRGKNHGFFFEIMLSQQLHENGDPIIYSSNDLRKQFDKIYAFLEEHPELLL